jgi:NAD kinase
MSLAPRAVVVHRRSELDELLALHGTRQQAAFVLATRGRSLDEVEERHETLAKALVEVGAAVPSEWRRGIVERAELERFLFAPEDVVIAIGQDGLVANVAKYLRGQPVIGVDPEPGRNPGVLVAHRAADVAGLLAVGPEALSSERSEARTMALATSDDGQRLSALNEVFVGHASHQSARYRLEAPAAIPERQSSSGVVVGTGSGATGWCASLSLERHSGLALPKPCDERLVWFVREAWPSPATGTRRTEGELSGDDELGIVAESERLVVFGDGIESDHLVLGYGQRVAITRSSQTLHLVG